MSITASAPGKLILLGEYAVLTFTLAKVAFPRRPFPPMGRRENMFMLEGKSFANGYPIGAIGGRADLMEQFSSRPGGPVFFAGTFNGHPAMAAAAIATLRKLQQEPDGEMNGRNWRVSRRSGCGRSLHLCVDATENEAKIRVLQFTKIAPDKTLDVSAPGVVLER